MSRSPYDWLPVRSRTRILVAFCFIVVIAVALTFLLRTPGTGASSRTEGTSVDLGFRKMDYAAPQFGLPLLEHHGDVQLSKLAGLPIVVNLWASYCGVCREESPAIAQVSRAAGEKVHFLGVDTLDERGAAIGFAKKCKLPFLMAYDPSGIVASKYRVPGLPVTFFISETGTKILGENVGALTAQNLIKILHRLYGVQVQLQQKA